MIIVYIILIALTLLEIITNLIASSKRRNKKKMTMECLQKMVEYNVLNATLNQPIVSEQALAYEYNKLFLKVEFEDAKPYLGYLFDLSESVTVGRDRENKIIIRDDAVSRVHCKFYTMNGQVFVQDLNSSNGTTIRGKWFGKVKLQSQNMVSVVNGDRVVVGGYVMRVYILYGYQVRK